MTETGITHDLQCTDILLQLAACERDQNSGGDGSPASEPTLEAELASTQARLKQKEQAFTTERQHAHTLQEQLLQVSAEVSSLRQQLASRDTPASTKNGAANSQDSFGMVLTLSSEREAALRERKLYKDRAADAEANVEQLESDLAAAHATAKLQAERANRLAARCDEFQRGTAALNSEKLELEQRIAQLEAQMSARHDAVVEDDTVTTLRRLLQERDNRILELEMQLTDRAGTPTMFGGDFERLTALASPTVIYALESLDTPGELHRLTRPVNTVGRGKTNDILLNTASVSRFHARLVNKPDGVWLVDLQSINGCHVNDRRTSSQVLSEGDLVVIGDCRFRFTAVSPCKPTSIGSAEPAVAAP